MILMTADNIQDQFCSKIHRPNERQWKETSNRSTAMSKALRRQIHPNELRDCQEEDELEGSY